MKIICTEKEKEQMITTILKSEFCPKFLVDVSNCEKSVPHGTCIDCLNKHLEWEIIE